MAPLRTLFEQVPKDVRTPAITHPAHSARPDLSYERLEFVGDAVLGLAIAAELYRRYPDATEGDIAKIRSIVVSRTACARVARDNGLDTMLLTSAPSDADRNLMADLKVSERVLGAVTESVIGACFFELGFDAVAEVVVESFERELLAAAANPTDPKTMLQEIAQQLGLEITYEITDTAGPDHDRCFTCRASLSSGATATATGPNKKSAELAAALLLCESYHRNGAA